MSGLFSFWGKKKTEAEAIAKETAKAQPSTISINDPPAPAATASEVSTRSTDSSHAATLNWRQRLQRTRERLGQSLKQWFKLGITSNLADDARGTNCWQELEAKLLEADLGTTVVQQLIAKLRQQRYMEADQLWRALRQALIELLQPYQANAAQWGCQQLETVLVVGVNGAGKTTTIGKLAYYFKRQGRRVLLAAGDTFRAAAVQQLEIWGERNQIAVVAQHGKADSAAVIYDAMQSAKAKHYDLLLADTAGRLHTQHDFMQELEKIIRVMHKFDPAAPQQLLLILDATIGQNAICQVEQFCKSAPVTGLCITKLDGTAKGGVVFAIAERFKLPIYFIGLGEQIDQLCPFEAAAFVDALLS